MSAYYVHQYHVDFVVKIILPDEVPHVIDCLREVHCIGRRLIHHLHSHLTVVLCLLEVTHSIFELVPADVLDYVALAEVEVEHTDKADRLEGHQLVVSPSDLLAECAAVFVRFVVHCSLRLVVGGFVFLLASQWAWDARCRLRSLRLRLVSTLVLEAVDAIVRLGGEGDYLGLVLSSALDKQAHSLVSGLQLGDVRLGSAETLVKVVLVVAYQPEEIGRYQRVGCKSYHDEEEDGVGVHCSKSLMGVEILCRASRRASRSS